MFPLIGAGVMAAALVLILFRRGKPRPFPWKERLIAHRGLHGGGVPENSAAAFAAAREAGVGAELDVRLTKDGVPVIMHDRTLLRMCGKATPVGSLTRADLAALSLPDGSRVPTLREALDTIGDGLPVVVEIKSASRRASRAVWEELKDRRGPVCVESFHPLTVHRWRMRRPGVIRGLLVQRRLPLLVTFFARPEFIAYDRRMKPTALLRRSARRGRPLAAWTLRSPGEVREEEKRGARMFLFEGFTPDEESRGETG